MAETKEKTVQAVEDAQVVKPKKDSVKKTAPVKEAEPEYDVETLAASGLFSSKSIVRAAMRNAKKTKATISEARKIIKQF